MKSAELQTNGRNPRCFKFRLASWSWPFDWAPILLLITVTGCCTPKLEKLVEQSRAAQQPDNKSKVLATSPSPAAPKPAGPTPRTPIRTLAVRITTSEGLFAGLGDLPDIPTIPGIPRLPLAGNLIAKSDNVWVDLGPRAWELGHNFPAGQTITRSLDISGPPMFLEDIIHVRLEKKGVLGFCNTPDSFLYGLGSIPSIADMIGLLRKQVQEQQYAITLLQGALGNKDQALKAVTAQYSAIASAITDLNGRLAELAKKINSLPDLQRQLDDAVNTLAHTPGKILKNLPIPKIHTPLGDITPLGPIPTIAVDNPLIDALTKTKRDLEGRLNNLRRDVTGWAIDQTRNAADLQLKLTEQAAVLQTKLAAEAAYQAAKLSLDTAQSVLKPIQEGLVKLEALAQKLPSFDLPTYGQWRPQSVTLIVDGEEKGTYVIDHTLKQGRYSWIKPRVDMMPPERFTRGLRLEPAKQEGKEQNDEWFDIIHHPDIFTTVFKNADISGWEYYPKDAPHVPVGSAKVIGHLVHPPSEGTDANVSLDLEVEAVETAGRQIVLNERSGYRQPRYIRIEYKFGGDHRFKNWHLNDRFEVTGEVRWDTDEGGFFEIHPVGAGSVRPLPPLR